MDQEKWEQKLQEPWKQPDMVSNVNRFRRHSTR